MSEYALLPSQSVFAQLEKRKHLFASQLIHLAVVGLAWLGILIINWLWTDFFVYPYLFKPFDAASLLDFWPLFIWLGVLILFSFSNGLLRPSTGADNELLFWGLVTGNMAALWEELGFRFAFICYAMISITFFNWLFGSFLVWVVVIGFAVVTLVCLFAVKNPMVATIPFILTLMTYQAAGVTDPVYWFYSDIVMPIISVLSFGSYDKVFDASTHNQLLVMGGILANAWFRDGHKYQGWFGVIDSWVVGFVFLYAMFNHGLLMAIALHAIWNTTLYLVEYLQRRAFVSLR